VVGKPKIRGVLTICILFVLVVNKTLLDNAIKSSLFFTNYFIINYHYLVINYF